MERDGREREPTHVQHLSWPLKWLRILGYVLILGFAGLPLPDDRVTSRVWIRLNIYTLVGFAE